MGCDKILKQIAKLLTAACNLLIKSVLLPEKKKGVSVMLNVEKCVWVLQAKKSGFQANKIGWKYNLRRNE